MSAGMVWAQQPASNQENIDDALRKLDSLARRQQVAALQAQIAAARAELAATSGHTLGLADQVYRRVSSRVAYERDRIEVLQVQLRGLDTQLARMKVLIWDGVFPVPAQPAADSPKIALPDRWWKNSVTSQYLALTADPAEEDGRRCATIPLKPAKGEHRPRAAGTRHGTLGFCSLRWMRRRSPGRSTAWRRLGRSSKKPTAGCCWGFASCSLPINGSS